MKEVLEMVNIELATVTEKGILLKSNYYSCPEAVSQRWFELARTMGEWQVVTVYNPDELFCMQVYAGNQNWFLCNVIHFNEISSSKLRKYFNSIQKLKSIRDGNRKNSSLA
ncbi:hypothetical protein A8709_08560 [Paenibacillus pectinilyticus]|uniref:Uncharacterized protein n=1 Tax=Paenibacillus pectinilyticus TaxID=512399 RepID=A0A1C1A847_9BACL|nr:Mu transposase C-terminal domain-containing protein [Paenibacillus pectinilyticus]OCT16709.1 hypothetical protein A8709_08560 [Paenibacillus pectinilyticus]